MIILGCIKFLVFLLLFPLPVGRLIYRLMSHQDRPSLTGSLVIGLLTLTLVYYLLLSFFGHTLALVIIVFGSLVSGLGQLKNKSLFKFSLPNLSLPGFLIISLAIYLNSLMLVPFGQLQPEGVALSGAHFIDSTWHLTLINSLVSDFPINNPLYSGTVLSNYHFLVDLCLSLIVRLTGISVPVLFFRLFGPFLLSLFALQLFSWLKTVTGRTFAGITGILLILLGSNFYYLVGQAFPDAAVTPSVAWIEFFSTKTVNYPLLFSLSVVLVLMEIVTGWAKPRLFQFLILGLLSGGLFGFKAHTALVWISALSAVSLHAFFRRQFIYLVAPLVSLVVVWSFSWGMVSTGSKALIFEPFWFIRVMYESPEHLNTPVWELKRQTLLSLHAYLGIGKLYAQGLFWFLAVNFGLTIFGCLSLLDSRLSLKLKIILTTFIVSGLGLTLLFVLASTAIVTIQFAYLALFAFTLFSVFALTRIYRKFRLLGLSLAVGLWVSLLPGVVQVTSRYQHTARTYNYGPDLITVVDYLARQKPGMVILTESRLRDGSFIPAYSRQSLYLGDPQILQSLFINSSARQADASRLLTCQSTDFPVDYVLVSDNSDLSACLRLVFSAGNYRVYLNPNRPQSKLP